MKKKLKYRRILLKLSGEVLRNRETGDSIDASRLAFIRISIHIYRRFCNRQH